MQTKLVAHFVLHWSREYAWINCTRAPRLIGNVESPRPCTPIDRPKMKMKTRKTRKTGKTNKQWWSIVNAYGLATAKSTCRIVHRLETDTSHDQPFACICADSTKTRARVPNQNMTENMRLRDLEPQITERLVDRKNRRLKDWEN